MKLNRRDFLLLTVGLAAGCQSGTDSIASASRTPRTINCGLAAKYAADGVYSDFKDSGFFVIRRDGQLFALSALCTHRKCKLSAQSDRSFLCPCHGSTFDPVGHVTEGPANRDLPTLSSHTNDQGQLIVSVPGW